VIVITIHKKFQQNILLVFWRNVNFLCKFDLFFFLGRGIANTQYHKVGKERKTYNRFIFLDNSQKEKKTQNYCARNEKLQLCLINAKKR